MRRSRLMCCPVCGDLWVMQDSPKPLGATGALCGGLSGAGVVDGISRHVLHAGRVVDVGVHPSELSSEQKAHYWALAKLFHAANSGE